ncbi:hypothetical protein TorRG33x02_103010 [Trema orientale]|uniref:Uncharacterized protein n=1 Tax=Trema orientale TaxID=63057 RepID=A0A2P5F803_TREOI|nr:hypothetical protein TorRG33x02_103010 [Trema orientale]
MIRKKVEAVQGERSTIRSQLLTPTSETLACRPLILAREKLHIETVPENSVFVFGSSDSSISVLTEILVQNG